MDRRALDGHRFSERILSSILSLRPIFSVVGLGDASEEARGQQKMKYPLHVVTGMVERGVKNALRGRKRQPMVLMLEPLYACNLACVGCALERHTGKLKDRLSVA